tara:strand:- start:1181 stop:1405 length:225 start_codon:yes stop_codon:yes gene_type:complete
MLLDMSPFMDMESITLAISYSLMAWEGWTYLAVIQGTSGAVFAMQGVFSKVCQKTGDSYRVTGMVGLMELHRIG